MSSATDTKVLVENAARRFLKEVPALEKLKIVVGLELRGRGDVQLYRLELPGPTAAKDQAHDARVRLSISRSDFNALAHEGRVSDWREAFETGTAKATGPTEILRLIANVVERHEERTRLRKARH